ncbi:MAG: hypothetical protein F6K26_28225 [Moorea sp. SIO2I5]|nr:hypothetical protein [Moorena sp. SIO2I5]
MANIKVNDIKPAGSELFGDSESFMQELSNDELNNLHGGKICSIFSLWCCRNPSPQKELK